ncbi:MAG: DUF4328 domain-containing protein [Bacteroidia bacterium]
MNFLYNNKSLIRILQVALWLYFIFQITTLVLQLAFSDKINSTVLIPQNPYSVERSTYLMLLLTALVSLLVSLSFTVLFIVWFYRVYENVNRCNSSLTSLSSGWAIGAWFVPVMNLFRPYRIMKEIWIGTQTAYTDNAKPVTPERPFFIDVWWISWMLAIAITLFGSLSNIRNSSPLSDAETPQQIAEMQERLEVFMLISSILVFVSLYALSQALAKLTEFEEELRERSYAALSRQQAEYVYSPPDHQ